MESHRPADQNPSLDVNTGAVSDVSSGVTSGDRQFAPTSWTLIQRAVQADKAVASKALTEIVHLYWQPLYTYARCRGHNPEDAADLTQGFFLYLLEQEVLHKADQAKGRLRSFLITVFRRYCGGEQARAKAWRRGGGATHLSLDFAFGEKQFQAADVNNLTPEALYDRNWAITVTNEAMRRLRDERQKAGKGHVFDLLRPHLSDADKPHFGALKEMATTLEMEESSLRSALFRLRKRFRECLLDVVAETLGTRDENEIRDELEALCHAMP
jgi:RNA polymerase sigma factor (sigma-70 family)